jgi:hypothetical protein
MVPKYLRAENPANKNVAPVRLNFRLIRGRSGAAGTVRRVSSCLVTHGPDLRRTGSSRLGKRVGETLKSSNLLSSASALALGNRKQAIPALCPVGSPAFKSASSSELS